MSSALFFLTTVPPTKVRRHKFHCEDMKQKRKNVYRLYVGSTTRDYFYDELTACRAAYLLKQLSPSLTVKVKRGWVYA